MIGRSFALISGARVMGQTARVWEALVCRRFQPNMHTRVSGVCLFAGGMTPFDNRYEWVVRTHLVLNEFAKTALPNWICSATQTPGQ
jgi:hypothetical protein